MLIDKRASVASDMVNILVKFYVPAVILFVLNTALVCKLYVSKSRVNVLRSRNGELRFALTVILTNVTFFVFNGPLAVIYIVNDVKLNSECGERMVSHVAVQDFALKMCQNATYVYSSFLFVVHFAFNKLFRKEVNILVRKVTVCK